jgi:hypothetical protein
MEDVSAIRAGRTGRDASSALGSPNHLVAGQLSRLLRAGQQMGEMGGLSRATKATGEKIS